MRRQRKGMRRRMRRRKIEGFETISRGVAE